MENIVETALTQAQGLWDIALGWLVSPQAWGQFGLLIASFVAAYFLSKWLTPRLRSWLTFPETRPDVIVEAGKFLIIFLPLLLPLAAYGFTAAGEAVASSVLGSSEVIAFGKRLFLFLALRSFVLNILTIPMLRLLGRFVLLPAGVLYVLGLLTPVLTFLENTVVPLGALQFDLLWLIKLICFAAVIFWLGSWSNERSTNYINNQEEIRPATRQLAAKTAEIAIYGIAFLVLMNIMNISLSALALLSGAIGVGLGFGLQKIASNFISGVILLLEGQATVGDYVELDGGEQGKIVKMLARAIIMETFDGKWIVVPNEDFIVTRVINYSDSGSANRYEAPFSVSYDTDINLVPPLVEAAVSKHPDILDKPFPPDCELRAFGDSGVEFAVEFWVNGLDDGPNKFTSDVLFIIWNTLKEHNIEIPYPQRVVEIKGDLPKLSS